MFRILTAVLASGAALVAAALPAAASSAQPTIIVDFATSVSTLTYQQPVTFTGELAKGQTAPVPDEPVQIQFRAPSQGQFVPVATGRTGTDGKFSISATLPSGGYVRAAFAGDTGLASSFSNPGWGIYLGVSHLPSRLVLDPVPSSVPAGTPVTFAGVLQVQVNGSWQPFPGAPLTLTSEPYTSSVAYPVTTGPDGRFTLTEPLSETSDWSVSTTLNGAYRGEWFPDYARAFYGLIDGVSRTRITGFSVPARDEAHHAYSKGLYATGTVERWNGSAWTGLAYGSVQFYYRPKGAKIWRRDGDAQTDAQGDFRGRLGVHLGTSAWQVRVTPAADTLTSTSTSKVTSTITDRTHFASASIQRHPSWSSISGQVTDWYKGQVPFSSLRGLKLRLYYQPARTKTWHAYKTTAVGAQGFFHFSEPKSRGYRFKVVLPRQGAFDACTSHTL